MNKIDLTKYLDVSNSSSWEVIGTPYSIDTSGGGGRYRYFKVTKTHNPYYKEEVRVDFEEVFEAAHPDLQVYFLFNLDLFKNRGYI